jgi:hypothetical protein
MLRPMVQPHRSLQAKLKKKSIAEDYRCKIPAKIVNSPELKNASYRNLNNK